MIYLYQLTSSVSMPWQRKEVPEVGVACLVFFFIHTEMYAIFQPIKKCDTYQIK